MMSIHLVQFLFRFRLLGSAAQFNANQFQNFDRNINRHKQEQDDIERIVLEEIQVCCRVVHVWRSAMSENVFNPKDSRVLGIQGAIARKGRQLFNCVCITERRKV